MWQEFANVLPRIWTARNCASAGYPRLSVWTRPHRAEFPAVRFGREVHCARLVFEGGEVVKATAESGERFLLETLDTDDGARRLGELGIGCNPAIQRYTRNVGFDEKIGGTVHLAVGSSYTVNGGKNVSAVHWDIVKDLRRGGRLYADGELVQEDGTWRV